jgi:Flp pilus assembly protein TadG
MKNKSLKTVLSKFKQSAARFKRDARGNMSIIMALSTVPVFGVAGLAIDVSHIRNTMAEMQSLADRAALHGMSAGLTQSDRQLAVDKFLAVNKKSYPGLLYTATGLADANSVGVQITTDIKSTLTSFVMTTSGTKPTIRARATVNPKPPLVPCLAAIDSSTEPGVNISGDGSITSPNCVVHSNSTNPSAGFVVSGGASGTAEAFTVVGGVSKSGNGIFTPAIKPNQPSLADPFADLKTTCPSKPAIISGTPVSLSGNNTQSYSNPLISNIGISGNSSATFSSASVVVSGTFNTSGNSPLTFKGTTSVTIASDINVSGTGPLTFETPVVYVFGNINLSGTVPLIANNTTIVLCGADAKITKSGTGDLQITAPKTGATKGFAVIGDSQVTQTSQISGTTASFIRGAWYTPKAKIEFSGTTKFNQSTSNFFPLIVKNISISGDGGLNVGIDYAKPNPNSNLPADAFPKPDALFIPQNEVYLTKY